MSPSDLNAHLGFWLRMVSNAVSQSFARKVEAKGVTVAEWVFLRALYDAEPIAPSELVRRIGLTKGAISKLADRLVRKGLVERTATPGDGRGQTLALKADGKSLVPSLASLADQNEAEFFRSLSPDERSQLEMLLRKVAADRHLKTTPTN